MGHHKKAVSLLNGNINTIDSQEKHTMVELNNPGHFPNQFSKHNESLKQSGVPSSQTSFYDYMTNNGGYQNDIWAFVKAQNYVMGEKSGSLLTHQQKQVLCSH